MNTQERITALMKRHGLPMNVDQLRTEPYGNGVNQFRAVETRWGVMVRRLELHLKRATHGPLGARLRHLEMLDEPMYKAKTKKGVQVLLYAGNYSPMICREHRDLTFIFGDNCQRVGNGGQAAIRDESNARGVVTKRAPSGTNQFFVEGSIRDMGVVCLDLQVIEDLLSRGDQIVLPVTGEGRISLGCGLAQLPYHAPAVYGFIERWFDRTIKTYSSVKV